MSNMHWLLEIDKNLFYDIHVRLHSTILDPLALLVTHLGRGEVQAAFLIFFACWKHLRKYALAGGIAGLFSGAVRIVMAHLVGRVRPSNFSFSHPLESVYSNTSFPSGHTTTSFAIAVIVLILTWGQKSAWVGWLLILLAGLIGMSRIYVGVHFPGYVLGGAVLGSLCAGATYLFMRKKYFSS